MFEDEEFEAGMEFTSDFLSSLNCRIFIPGSELVAKGDKLAELYLIYKGTVSLALDSVSGNKSVFLVLPTHSYFGDYHLILNIKSQFVFK
jgi:signal-transduction protein with cAMP-binding, CBS, and nucleotidyltransferase domain